VRRVIGIDRGVSGALALVSATGELIEVADMPTLRDGSSGRAAVNAPLLAELLARWHAQEAICEFVSARSKEGAVGAFSFGRSPGLVEGVCAALGVPIRFLTPPTWKRFEALAPVENDAAAARLCLANDDDAGSRYHLKRVVECVKAAASAFRELEGLTAAEAAA
jgi:crossover junction endodeoxyribonuclease RuvC